MAIEPEDHSERGHSGIGPSAAHRWIACPGSVAASKALFLLKPELENSSSPQSREGTMAHELAEAMVIAWIYNEPFDTDEWASEVHNPEDFNLIEMIYHCENFLEYVTEFVDEGDLVLPERRLDMPRIHKDSYGTGDVTIIKRKCKTVHTIDLKYGAGVYVDVVNNDQARMYAEGAKDLLLNHRYEGFDFNPEEYVLHIYQPRSNPVNIAQWSINEKRLNEFVKDAHEAAKLTELPLSKAIFNPGEKQCHWCPCNGDCKPLDDYMHTANLAMFDSLDEGNTSTMEEKIESAIAEVKSNPNILSSERKGQLLKLFPMMVKYMDAVKSAAMSDALNNAAPKGFKLVAGRNSYKCTDLETLEFLLGDEAFKDKENRSRSDLQKRLGVQFKDLGLDDYFESTPGNPTLALESDKRPELPPPNIDAIDDFDSI